MAELAIIDRTGDTKLLWDPSRPDEVATAEAAFNTAKAKGMVAYRVDPETGAAKTGEVIRTFDAQAEKIIMRPAMVGG